MKSKLRKTVITLGLMGTFGLNYSTNVLAQEFEQVDKGGSSIDLITDSSQEIVQIPDAILSKAIRNQLNKPTGDITRADMEQLLEIFILDVKNLKSLEGLEYATNLKSIVIVPPTLDGGLEFMCFDTSEFSSQNTRNQEGVLDLSPLSELSQLEKLWLGGVNVDSLNSLATLSNLQELFLVEMAIDNLTPLNQLSSLKKLQLFVLPNVTNLNFLNGLNNLEYLAVLNTPISDISPLAQLPNLKTLGLFTTSITDFSPLEELELETFEIAQQCGKQDVVLKNNQLENPFKLPDGNYSKLEVLEEGRFSESEDGSILTFNSPKKGDKHVVMGFIPMKGYDDGIPFIMLLTIEQLIGDPNLKWEESKQFKGEKEILLDFTNSFYPIERIVLPDGTEVQGNQTTFIVSESDDYSIKVYDSQGNEYTETLSITIKPAPTLTGEDVIIEVGETFDILTLITAKDADENLIQIDESHILSNNIDFDTPGVYEVHYQVTDTYHSTSEKVIKVTVIEKEIIEEDTVTPDNDNSLPEQEESTTPDNEDILPEDGISSTPSEKPLEDETITDKNDSNETSTPSSKPSKPIIETGVSSLGILVLGGSFLVSGILYDKRKFRKYK